MENKMIKILAIDDNRDNLITLKAIIAEVIPQSVVYVELSGQSGIESARNNDPDVILLDIVMPGMDGYQVCKILKADEHLSETPIIFLTAIKGDKQSRILALEAGGEAFLAKPIDATELKAQILAMLKIKEAATYKRNQRLHLEELVQKRTEELKGANIAALNLLEDLHAEIEIRKQSEEALRMSKELLSETESIGKVGGWSFNIDTMEQKWTDEVYRIHEIEISQEPSVDSGINYYTKESRPIIEKAVQRAIEHGENYDLELEIITAKGNTRAVQTIGKADLKNRRIYGFFQDITERKQAEEKLKLLNRAIESSSVAVEITDVEGNINYVNPFFTELTGYSHEEVLGKNPRILKSGHHSKTFYKELWNTILSGREWTGEFRNKKKNGELYWEKAFISPILNSNGKVVNFVAIKDDITERKKILEELVVAKGKAEESDKLKTAFINNISHEIRTPLNSILGFGQMLAESDLSYEDRTKFYIRVNQSSNRLMNTITDYMDIAMIVSGTKEANKKEFVLQPLFEDATKTSAQLCSENNIAFYAEIPPGSAPLIINSDPEFLQIILDKLLDNAIKFTREGRITCGYNVRAGHVAFFVKDTGYGIDNDKLEMIFKIFGQADTSMTRGHEGSGLGLNIAKGLVTLLGGEILVATEKGKGSVFTFTIPFDKADHSILSYATTTINAHSSKNPLILIAEDDDLNYEYLAVVVESLGYKHILAINGVEAVKLCRQNPDISIVFMDIKMPLMNGVEATRQIREFRPDLPIIATTAYAQTGDEHRFLAAGCNDYVAKPFKIEKLSSLIRKYAE